MRRVDEVMTVAPLVTIDSTAAAAVVARLMSERGVSHVLVLEQDVLAGVVCVCDLERSVGQTAAGALMSRAPSTIELGESAFAAARCMLEKGISCLPVVQSGDLVGIVTLSDLRRAGVVQLVPERCAACGDIDHVRSSGHDSGVGLCLECKRSSLPPSWDDDLGGG